MRNRNRRFLALVAGLRARWGQLFYSVRRELPNSGRQRLNLHGALNAATNEVIVQRVWKFFRKKVLNNRYYATFREFTEEALMFFKCLSEYADELRTLLAHNFQLFGQATGKTVTNAS